MIGIRETFMCCKKYNMPCKIDDLITRWAREKIILRQKKKNKTNEFACFTYVEIWVRKIFLFMVIFFDMSKNSIQRFYLVEVFFSVSSFLLCIGDVLDTIPILSNFPFSQQKNARNIVFRGKEKLFNDATFNLSPVR